MSLRQEAAMLGVIGQTYTDSGGGGGAGLAVVYFILYAVYVAGLWGIFTKAGQEGWKAIIPIYNMIVLLKIAGRPWWWVLLLIVPIVNIVIVILWYSSLSKSFGKGTGFTLGLCSSTSSSS
jgi:cobalamin synthase